MDQIPTTITSVIFDLGGVIIDIDVDRALRSLSGLTGQPESISDWNKDFFHLFEMGMITEAQFRDNLRAVIGSPVSDQVLDDCWNELLGDMPLERLERLREIAGRYRMVLLSNTNSIHMRAVTGRLQEVSGAPGFEAFFTRVYCSHEIHLSKPDPRIFRLVMSENNFEPAKTLLVDDNKDNIESAAQLGMKVFKVNQPCDWLDYFSWT